MTYSYLQPIWRESYTNVPSQNNTMTISLERISFMSWSLSIVKIGVNVCAQKRMFWVVFPMCVCNRCVFELENCLRIEWFSFSIQQPFGWCVKNRCSVRTCVEQWRCSIAFLLSLAGKRWRHPRHTFGNAWPLPLEYSEGENHFPTDDIICWKIGQPINVLRFRKPKQIETS